MTDKRFRSAKWIGLLVLALVLIVTAGCQALGGVDFNAMLKQTLKVTSYESNQKLEMKLLVNNDSLAELPKEEQELFNLISNISVQLDNTKTSKNGELSAEGKLSLGEKTIGFKLAMDQKLVSLNLDGAKKPIVIHLPQPEAGAAGAASTTAASQESLTETGMKMLDSISGFTIDNLPNPTHLSVDAGQDTINGESVIGMKIHAELTGTELLDWMKSYIDALLKDQEGMKSMITGVYEALASQADALQSSGAAAEVESIFGSLPEEDESANQIDQAIAEITDMLTQASEELKTTDPEDQKVVDGIFTKDTYVKGDVFVDSKLDIRKSVIEASIKPDLTALDEMTAADQAAGSDDEDAINVIQADRSDIPFEGVWFRMTTERWNVNGDVVPVKPEAPAGAFDMDQAGNMQGYDVLRQFEPNSVVYGLLHNQLHISKQAVSLDLNYSRPAPILTPAGVTLVPMRAVAESLGAKISKDASGKLHVIDPATNGDIVLKVGSSSVVVNGKTEKWSFPPTVVNGTTYVPARPFIAALKGSLSWEKSYFGDGNMIVITREPV
ncbi:copper amine oxidase-like protein [Paenibacillus taihuensis]|uniref:Copper amine oxidase-like protein n=1 Tax=Paenibacillus taihuensis TaxID=1156355 RepID=A0A3D9SDC1_9BACL|nr:copper amine oxidase N-terminal domain-containing protein [Paenibacillus taihuensis]REE92888.1 copper amine oxidase-like protein [Paenibacillus taihuensis]